MTFYSIPGMSVHQNSDDAGPRPQGGSGPVTHGDQPGMVDRPVLGPDGRVLYTRKVYEEGFAPGLDTGDNVRYHGDKLEKVTDMFDRSNARTTTVYRRFSDDGKYRGEVAVDHDQQTARGDDVVARSKSYKE